MSRALALAERARICDLFDSLGPDHPTLCEGWTNHHLAAHLVVREWRPLAGAGIVVPPLHRFHEAGIERLMTTRTYDDLVARLRKGAPPWWKPTEGLTNFGEYFIHLEDVRRGAGDHAARPEAEIADVEEALWSLLRRSAKLAVRRAKGIGVRLADPNGRVHEVREEPEGAGTVTISGRPGELQLYLAGRRNAAAVEVSGDAGAVDVLARTRLGI